ncbi:hypothetical protein LCGC14_0605590 [marine sediment metagenome]|uniref:Uncharacterized protein n=1 Tax=marine sediment metagenome TaxID=412755 RepID=A0A0F9TVG4_9ZZZZ
MTRQRTRSLRERTSEAVLEAANAIRRVIFGDTAGGLWGILGYETDDDSEGEDAEPVETFQGIGIYARPAAGDKAEGLMLHVGSQTEHPVLAAFRNEDARRRMVEKFGDIGAGEVALFPSTGDVRVLLKVNGTIEIGGTATQPLATKADLETLRVWLAAHGHPLPPGSPPNSPPPVLLYSQIIKGE